MPPESFDPQKEKRPERLDPGRANPEQEAHFPRAAEDRGESVGDPDVLLDVPVLNVEELDLEVEDLRARVSFQAELADMVKINVGIDAEVGKAKIGIQGIEAQAQLKARLDNVRAIFSEVLTALQKDPELAQNMLRAAESTDDASAETVRDAPVRTEQAGQGADDESENAADDTDDAAGGEASNLADLPIEEEYIDDQGRIVGRARGESGEVLEEIMDEEGNVLRPNAPEETEANGVEATNGARRRADELGLKLSDVKGTGSGGRILVRDVEAVRDGG